MDYEEIINKDLGSDGKQTTSAPDLTGSVPPITPDHHHHHQLHPSSPPSSLRHTKLQTSEIDIVKLKRGYPSIYEAVLALPRNLSIRSAYGLSMTKKFYKGMWNNEKWLRRWLKTRKRASKLPTLTLYILNLQVEMKKFLTWDFIIREYAYYQRPAAEVVDIELREDLRAYPKKSKEEEEQEKKVVKEEVSAPEKVEIDYLEMIRLSHPETYLQLKQIREEKKRQGTG